MLLLLGAMDRPGVLAEPRKVRVYFILPDQRI